MVGPLVVLQYLETVLGVGEVADDFLQVGLAPQVADVHGAAADPQFLAPLGLQHLAEGGLVVDVFVLDDAVVEFDEGFQASRGEDLRLADGAHQLQLFNGFPRGCALQVALGNLSLGHVLFFVAGAPHCGAEEWFERTLGVHAGFLCYWRL